MKKLNLEPQLILSIGVLVVSFAALFVSMRQASLLNRQTEILLQQMKSSAWPSLMVDMHFAMTNDSSLTAFRIHVRNKGLGPAVIEGVKVTVDGEPTSTWLELISRLDPPDGLLMDRSSSSLYQQVLSPGEEKIFLDLGNNLELMNVLYGQADRMAIEICYRSIYDEHWLVIRDRLTADGSSVAQKVEACQFQETDNFIVW